MKTIFILCDTLNRRMLDIYDGKNTAMTPNIDRLAKRGTIFDNHFCGSAPCMPARRDILTGRMNFLEKPWGGMEPFDFSMPDVLATKNVHSQMFSDHSHYIIPGGENYTKGFTAWDVYRGQEADPWKVCPDKNGIKEVQRPKDFKGEYFVGEEANKSSFKTEYDYPSVKTLYNASTWLETNHDADNFMLWIETFDPHEPYDCPKHYLDLYEKDYDGVDYIHPDYQPSVFSDKETEHLVNRCKALMTMTDRHIGEVLDVLDKYNMWEDTVVVLTTDHGFHLGEHGFMAKNYMPPYNEVFHIPMIIAHPDVEGNKRCSALTQNIDVLPTFMECYGIPEETIPYKLHGKSLISALKGEEEQVHDGIIYGYFGRQIGYTDGKYTYTKCSKDDTNRPLSMYTAMPTFLRQVMGVNDALNIEDYDKIEMGKFLKFTNYPVYKYDADIIHLSCVSQDFNIREHNKVNMLFDIEKDYEQKNPIKDAALENEIIAKLKQRMIECDSPDEQFERFGI